MKILLGILFAFGISLSCLGRDALITSSFDKMIPVKVPSWARPRLDKRHVDIVTVELVGKPGTTVAIGDIQIFQ